MRCVEYSIKIDEVDPPAKSKEDEDDPLEEQSALFSFRFDKMSPSFSRSLKSHASDKFSKKNSRFTNEEIIIYAESCLLSVQVSIKITVPKNSKRAVSKFI